MTLWEDGNIRKKFNKREAKQIIKGTLDVTEFFENKKKSTKRLMDALKGRPVYPGHKEREEFREKFAKLREKIKAFREKHKIEDPPEHAAVKIKMVSKYSNKYREKKEGTEEKGEMGSMITIRHKDRISK
jgi:capsule polysaccharide export protein KpsE/RkpR